MRRFSYILDELLKRISSALPLFILPFLVSVEDVGKTIVFLAASAPFLLISELGIFQQTCRDGRRISPIAFITSICIGILGFYFVKTELAALVSGPLILIFIALCIRSLLKGFIEAYALFHKKIEISILSSFVLISSFFSSYFLAKYQIISQSEIFIVSLLIHCLFLFFPALYFNYANKNNCSKPVVDMSSSLKILCMRFTSSYIDSRVLLAVAELSTPNTLLALSYLIRGCEFLGALTKQGLLNRFVSRSGLSLWRRRKKLFKALRKVSLFSGLIFYAIILLFFYFNNFNQEYLAIAERLASIESLFIILSILFMSPFLFVTKKSLTDNLFIKFELIRRIIPFSLVFTFSLTGVIGSNGFLVYLIYIVSQTMIVIYFNKYIKFY